MSRVDLLSGDEESRSRWPVLMGKAAQAPALPPQLDPEQVPACMSEPNPEPVRRTATRRALFDLKAPQRYKADWKTGPLSFELSAEQRKEVGDRLKRAPDLTVGKIGELQYHVTGGTDPDGHHVDLSWAPCSDLCGCGDHLWREGLCKHLMAVLLSEGWDGIQVRDLAYAVEIANEAKRVAFRSLLVEKKAA